MTSYRVIMRLGHLPKHITQGEAGPINSIFAASNVLLIVPWRWFCCGLFCLMSVSVLSIIPNYDYTPIQYTVIFHGCKNVCGTVSSMLSSLKTRSLGLNTLGTT